MRATRLQALAVASACFFAGSLFERRGLLQVLEGRPPPPLPATATAAAAGDDADDDNGDDDGGALDIAGSRPRSAAAVESLVFPAALPTHAANRSQTLLIVSPVRNRGSSHKTPIAHFFELVRESNPAPSRSVSSSSPALSLSPSSFLSPVCLLPSSLLSPLLSPFCCQSAAPSFRGVHFSIGKRKGCCAY